MGDKIRSIAVENIWTIILYAFTITIVMIAVIVYRKLRKKRFVKWKTLQINLFIARFGFEKNDDDFLQELFEENQRLEADNKKLKKVNSKIPLLEKFIRYVLGIGIFMGMFIFWKNSKKDD